MLFLKYILFKKNITTLQHVLPDLFGFPLVDDTASEHFSQNTGSLKAGQLNG